MTTAAPTRSRVGRSRPARSSVALRSAFAALVAAMLVAAITGGLWRAGTSLPAAAAVARSGGSHAALMLAVFLGATISIERAVALGRPWAYAAPLLALASGVLLVLGASREAACLGVGAAAVFVAVGIVLLRRERGSPAAMMLVAALGWLAGNVLAAARPGDPAVVVWWFAFPILTITAERLELTRFLPRRRGATVALWTIVGAVVGAAAIAAVDATLGGVAFGIALMSLALWLALFDIARRTVFMRGLARYIAIALLLGYVWLGIGGLAWLGTALGCPGRDMALHALGLGFVFSMVFGHAPVIVPAITRVRLRFGAWFYLPLALLHASLACRLFGAIVHPAWRVLGAQLNAAAIALFAATIVGSALAWRIGDERRCREHIRARPALPA